MNIGKTESIKNITTVLDSNYISVGKNIPENNKCVIPSSKPETQRGIIIASLASGTSFIQNDLSHSQSW